MEQGVKQVWTPLHAGQTWASCPVPREFSRSSCPRDRREAHADHGVFQASLLWTLGCRAVYSYRELAAPVHPGSWDVLGGQTAHCVPSRFLRDIPRPPAHLSAVDSSLSASCSQHRQWPHQRCCFSSLWIPNRGCRKGEGWDRGARGRGGDQREPHPSQVSMLGWAECPVVGCVLAEICGAREVPLLSCPNPLSGRGTRAGPAAGTLLDSALASGQWVQEPPGDWLVGMGKEAL